jgi:hypothetical protein
MQELRPQRLDRRPCAEVRMSELTKYERFEMVRMHRRDIVGAPYKAPTTTS